MYLIDTNVLLEFLLGQEKADECINLIESLVHNKILIFISRFGLYTIEIIMIINKKQSSLIKFIDFLMAYNKIQMFPSNLIAQNFGFKSEESFTLENAAEKAVPKVSF